MVSEISALRSRLAGDEYRWLDVFREPLIRVLGTPERSSTYSKIRELLQSRPRLDAYDVDTHIDAATQILDRCLLLRREFVDLRGLAMKAAVDVNLALENVKHDRAIELSKFGSISAAVQDAINTKWDNLESHFLGLRARYSEPNGVLNFGERAGRLRELFVEEFLRAVERIRIVHLGLRSVYGNVENLPELPALPEVGDLQPVLSLENDYLDALAKWLRRAVVELEVERQRETTFEVIVPGRQPSRKRSSATLPAAQATHQVITTTDWDSSIAELGDGLLEFDVRMFFQAMSFPDGTRLRLQGIGASLSVADPAVPAAALVRCACVVFPPDVPDPSVDPTEEGADEVILRRQPLILGSVGITNPGQTRMNTGPMIKNIDPRGTWKIRLSTNHGYPNQALGFSGDHVKDVKLHLVLRAQLPIDLDVYKEFFG